MTVTLAGLIPLATDPNLHVLANKKSAGLLFMIFIVESDLCALTAPIIAHLDIYRDFIATASKRK